MVRYLLGGGPPLKEQSTVHCPYFSVVQVKVSMPWPPKKPLVDKTYSNGVALENIGLPELIFWAQYSIACRLLCIVYHWQNDEAEVAFYCAVAFIIYLTSSSLKFTIFIYTD